MVTNTFLNRSEVMRGAVSRSVLRFPDLVYLTDVDEEWCRSVERSVVSLFEPSNTYKAYLLIQAKCKVLASDF